MRKKYITAKEANDIILNKYLGQAYERIKEELDRRNDRKRSNSNASKKRDNS